MKSNCCLIVAAFLLAAPSMRSSCHADILLPKAFCDHMVLQRNSTVPVSGTAKPGQELVLLFQEQQLPVTAGDDGAWMIQLETGEAGGPFEIKIEALGEEAQVVINDVMVGDVWLCAGQSNMAWPVSDSLNPEVEIEQSRNFTDLRLFRVEQSVAASPRDDFGKVEPWQICSPETVKSFSATSYFFGRELVKNVKDVPIGLISSAVGGTPCEAWMSSQKINSIDSLKALREHWEKSEELNSSHRPANLFNGMIAPLSGFPIRGVIWYQGEANVGRGAQYKQLFPALIEDWRQTFSNPELPFYFAQLAPYRYQTLAPESLPELWEAQLQTMKKVPGTGMAILTDVGDLDDIHPKNKQEVGRRLALLALGNLYSGDLAGQEVGVDLTGPIVDSISIENSQVTVKFTFCQSGLKAAGGSRSLTGFSVCGDDEIFYPASAKIEGDTVVVSATEVPAPVAVRFGWDTEVTPNLINGDGLPASPFRTDNFPVISASPDF